MTKYSSLHRKAPGGFLSFLLPGLLLVAGCTATEWGRVRDDLGRDLPGTIERVANNPGVSTLLIALGSLITGLVAKSAARGFGRGVKATARGTAQVCRRIVRAKAVDPRPTFEAYLKPGAKDAGV